MKNLLFVMVLLFSGAAYADECLGDCQEGNGILKYDNGAQYIGAWKKGKQEGQGILTLSNGMLWYNGEWKNGLPNGYGFMLVNYRPYKGHFTDGVYDGK